MPTPIEIAISVLGAKSAADATAGISAGFSLLAEQLLKTIPQFTALIATTIEGAEQMGRFSRQIGLTSEKLSTLAHAARTSNVSQKEFERGLSDLRGTMDLAARGQGDAAATFRQLNVAFLNGNGTFRDLDAVLLDLADRFSSLPDGPQKSAYATRLFTQAGLAMIPVLNQGRGGLERLRDEGRSLGAEVGGGFARNAAAFNDNLTKIYEIVGGLANRITTALLPSLVRVSGAFEKMASLPAFQALLRRGSEFLGGALEGASMQALEIGRFFSTASSKGIGAAFTEWRNRPVLPSELEPSRKPDHPVDNHPEADPLLARKQLLHDLAESELSSTTLERPLDFLPSGGVTTSGGKNARFTPLPEQTRAMRVRELSAAYREQISLLEQLSKEAAAPLKSGIVGADERIEIEKQQTAFTQKRYEILLKVQALERDNTFLGKMTANLRQLRDQWSNLGASMADVFTNTLGGAVTSFSQATASSIVHAKNLGEALGNAGMMIEEQLLTAIIQLPIQWLLSHTLMEGISLGWKAFLSAMRAEDVVEANATEAAKTPTLAANATLASIGSWGVAVAIGLAAIAGILAATGAFAEGGMIRGEGTGTSDSIVARLSNGEHVTRAASVASLGERFMAGINAGVVDLSALNPGASVRGAGRGAAGTGGGGSVAGTRTVQNFHFGFHSDESSTLRHLDTVEGRKFLVNAGRQTVREITGKG